MTRRERQERTRRRLLDAAAELFADRGLDGASVQDVADRAGFTKGAFYANFRSKEQLFLEMLDERFATELERLDAALPGTDDPEQEARAAATAVIHSAGAGEWPRLYFQFAAYATRDEAFRAEFAARQRTMRDKLAEIFTRWSADVGVPPPLPVEQIAAMTFFMADGFLVNRLIEPAVDEELYATMLGVFFRGLEALSQSPAAR